MRPANPTSADVMHAWFRHYFQDLHTAFPARVQSYDATTQTADLEPLIRHAVEQPDGSTEYEELPILPGVPIMFPRTAGWMIALPMDVGDTVLVICAESAIGNWRAGDGSLEYPGDLRRHHIASAVAIPGLFVHSAALANAPPKLGDAADSDPAIVIGKDVATGSGPRFELRKGGDISILQGSGKVLHLGSASGTTDFIIPGDALHSYLDSLHSKINDLRTALNQLIQDYGVHSHTGQAGPYPVVITPGPQVPTSASAVNPAMDGPPDQSRTVRGGGS